ncbi:MAG: LexA family transcriptional regulator [Cytophagaceae bacterium]|nr:LexA family transcriptional regulator [Cytophagaceae bacterium]
MSLISENIRFLRKRKGLTQEQMAERLGIKRSLVGAYEEGRAEPGLGTLLTLAKLFELSVDALISEELWHDEALKKAQQRDIEGKKLRVLSISVDKEDNENIHLVPQKASAGYLNGYADPEFVGELPTFYLPIFNDGTYRAFEIKGDSMLPLTSGTIIIGRYVEDWRGLRDDKTYVLVTKTEGIVYKRVFNHLKNNQSLSLVSDNKAFESYEVKADEINEIWEARAFLSTEFPNADMSLEKLSSMVIKLQEEIKHLKS